MYEHYTLSLYFIEVLIGGILAPHDSEQPSHNREGSLWAVQVVMNSNVAIPYDRDPLSHDREECRTLVMAYSFSP